MIDQGHNQATSSAEHMPLSMFKDKEQRDKFSPAAFKIFNELRLNWAISDAEAHILLGDTPKPTFDKWKRSGAKSLNRDHLERISLFIGAHKALQLLFASKGSAKRWLKSKNTDLPFCGLSPLDYILEGSMDRLYGLRRYLDAWRGGK